MTKRRSIPRKAKRGRPASLSDDDLLIAALWMKHLALRPVTKQSDYALATALRTCREPAVNIVGHTLARHLAQPAAQASR